MTENDIIAERLPENAPGPWFVNDECISCGLCGDHYPEIFRPMEDFSSHIVHRQPENEAEEKAAIEAAEDCPVLAIKRESRD